MQDNNSTANIFSREEEQEQAQPQPVEQKHIYTSSGDRKCEDIDVINLQHIHQVYESKKSNFVLFDDLNLDIKDFSDHGQFISILGPSGCGKSTILRYISGLQKPTSGKILIYGKERTEKDVIPMVFQQYSSLPWKTVLENVALPLLMHGHSKTESYDKAMEMIKAMGLLGHENKWAKYPLLSGGQLQRVAIARNLIASPQILLMDEPFGALDIATRTNMQQTLLDIFNNSKLDPTVFFVTHDINEAVLLSNRIYIMAANPGRIQAVVDIDFHQVRDASLKKSEKFSEYVNYIDNTMSTLSEKKQL